MEQSDVQRNDKWLFQERAGLAKAAGQPKPSLSDRQSSWSHLALRTPAGCCDDESGGEVN